MSKFAILALAAVCAPMMCSQQSVAQRIGGSVGHFSHAMPAHRPASVSGSLASRQDLAAFRRLYRGGPYGDLLSSLGVLSDFAGDPSGYGYPASAPNFFLMPPTPATGMIEEPQHPAAQPLMIELRGDHYVRITNGKETAETDSHSADYRQAPIATSGTAQQVSRATSPIDVSGGSNSRTTQDLQPAVLIYRDGHQEDVRDYAITGGKLYARGNYYTDGYWTKTIDLAGLNVPATITSNAQRGVNFVLPGAANEVVTRP
jgi:hypothetical protein